jgi:hypothetical protein
MSEEPLIRSYLGPRRQRRRLCRLSSVFCEPDQPLGIRVIAADRAIAFDEDDVARSADEFLVVGDGVAADVGLHPRLRWRLGTCGVHGVTPLIKVPDRRLLRRYLRDNEESHI